MEAVLTLVALGLAGALFVLRSRMATIERTMAQVVAEVQRNRDILGGQPEVGTVAEASAPGAPPVARTVRVAPVAAPEPVAAPAPAARRLRPPRLDFEEVFGSKLPIWAGGMTLAVAGVFIVKYSIDIGLITPPVRIILALGFAALLIAGAEGARRWSATAIDPRVAQALAGAGVATAYAAVLMAANLFHLIGPGVAFAGLAANTAGALGLALRFGAPSAVLGLVGGLAAPALVGGKGSIGILAVYLSLTILGLAGVARTQRWRWLAALALVGGFGWGAVMLVMQALDGGADLEVGGYLLLLAFAVPVVAGDDARGLLRLLPPAVAALELAILVVTGGYAPLVWGLYALLAAAVIVLARIDARQRSLPWVALAAGLMVVALWPHPSSAMLTAVLLIGGGLFAADAAQRVGKGDWRDAAQFAGALIGGVAVGYGKLPGVTTHGWATIELVLAAAALALAATLWRAARRDDGRFALLMATGIVLTDLALVLTIQRFWLPDALVLVAAAAMAVAHRAQDRRMALAGRVALVVGVTALFIVPQAIDEASRVMAWVGPPSGASLVRYLMVAVGTALVAWRELDRANARIVAVVAWALAFIALAQVAPEMGPRVLMTMLLAVGGALAWRLLADRSDSGRWAGRILTTLALARTLWFDVAVSNPLWVPQDVGSLPVTNWLAPAYLLPLTWIAVAVPREPALRRHASLLTTVQMLLILVFAATTVRQLFHGSVLAVGDVTRAEDIARSLVAIGLAVGFLIWGIRVRVRMWRVASLVLMLGAVGKVFLFDVAGLDGLQRIGSFVALGFSLIGIGWLYSRYLARDDAPLQEATA